MLLVRVTILIAMSIAISGAMSIAISGAISGAMSGATAWGGTPDHAFDETERHERWSWAPLISAAFATGSPDGPPALFGAQLRARYGRSREANAYHGQDKPLLVSFGLAIDTAGFESVEPSAVVGLHRLPGYCECWSNRVWWNQRADLGVGYAWAERDAPFVTVKLGLGAMFSRPINYLYSGRSGLVSSSKDRFRSQLDLFVASQVTLDGEWRVAAGIELDPLRLIPDVLAIFWRS